MTALLAVAGVACSGNRRLWMVTLDRRLLWRGDEADADTAFALRAPIPGSAAVLIANPFQLVAVLADGGAWRLDVRGGPQWRPLHQEGLMKDETVFIAGGTSGQANWVATTDRRLWVWNLAGKSALVEAPVPGTARILAVDVAARAVVLDDGSRYAWLGSRWAALSNVTDGASGTVHVRCTSGFRFSAEHGDLTVGQELDLPEKDARPYLSDGRLEIVERAHGG